MQNILILIITSLVLTGCLSSSTNTSIKTDPNIIPKQHTYLVKKYDFNSHKCLFTPQYRMNYSHNPKEKILSHDEVRDLNHKMEAKVTNLYYRVKLISSRYRIIDKDKVARLKHLSKQISAKHDSPFHHLDHKIDISNSMTRFKEIDKMARNLPIFAPVKQAQISSKFGRRKLKGRKRCMHKGLDLVGVKNGRIYSSANGKVLESTYSRSYGHYILIQHKDNLKTRYAHLKRSMVSRGQYVRQGEVIGIQGSTGRSTKDHLHFEVILGKKHLNPINFIGKEIGCHRI